MTLAYVSYGVKKILYKICVFFIMLAIFLLLKLYYQNLVEDVEEHTYWIFRMKYKSSIAEQRMSAPRPDLIQNESHQQKVLLYIHSKKYF